jgi:hypothetical protein
VTEYFEDRQVGAHLRAHRERLGVARSELIAAYTDGSDQDVRFAERAEHPALRVIERYHTALMAAYVGAPGRFVVPLARREQWYATEADTALWQQAMQASPAVVWWWGVRSQTSPRGAWCHLCNTMIHGYDVGRGMTARARKAVMAHRLQHISTLTAASAAQTKESGT